MRTSKKILIFLLANLLVVLLVGACLQTPYVLDLYVKEFQAGDYNTIILGQSSSEVGVDPHLLDNEEDTVYNFCRGGMNVHNMIYLLKNINRNSQVHKIYLSLDYSYWVDSSYQFEVVGGANGDSMYLLTQSLRHLENPVNILTQLQHQEIGNLLFNYRLNKQTITGIPYVLKSKLLSVEDSLQTEQEYTEHLKKLIPPLSDDYSYMGRGFSSGIDRKYEMTSEFESGLLDTEPDMRKVFDERYVEKRVLRGFDQVVSYCEENQIELICFIPPQMPKYLWTQDHGAIHDYFSALCAQYNLPLYDFNYLKFEYLPRNAKDYVDMGGHVMGYLAEQQTGLFREILNSPDPDSYFVETFPQVRSSIKAYSLTR